MSMINFRMNRFVPTGEYPERSEETRIVTAETEAEAYTLIGEPTDGSYWHITDSKPVELPDYLAGRTGRMFCACPAGDCALKIPGVKLGEGHFCRKGSLPDMGELADTVAGFFRGGNRRDTRQAFLNCTPLAAAALALAVHNRLVPEHRTSFHALMHELSRDNA